MYTEHPKQLSSRKQRPGRRSRGSRRSGPHTATAIPRLPVIHGEACPRGDEASFAELFTAHHAGLCRYARGYLGCPGEAQEVVSDVFFRLWHLGESWCVRGNVRSYLYRAVRNGALDRLRSRRRAVRALTAAAVMEVVPGMAERGPTQEEEVSTRELASLIERTLAGLPPRPAEAFRLQREHGLSYLEIGEVMGIAASTVEKHMMRALRDLREAITRADG